MSLKAVVWAWDQDISNQGELLVLLALADYADDKCECWPGQPTLMAKARIKSNSTLQTKLNALRDAGYIDWDRRPKVGGGSRSSMYWINMEQDAQTAGGNSEPEPEPQAQPEQQLTPQPAEIPETAKIEEPELILSETAKIEVSETAIFESETAKIEGSYISEPVSKNLSDITPLTPHALNLSAWADWTEYKKTQFGFRYKSQSTETLATKMLIELASGDHDMQQRIVNQSIANGWKGLFALKTTEQQGANGGYKPNYTPMTFAEMTDKSWTDEYKFQFESDA